MEREKALRLLPVVHARAIELAEQGGVAEVAAHLGVDERAVGPLLVVARAKLAALLERDEPTVLDDDRAMGGTT
jgi:DNA-directed RNA polymerase specialized sigma24 family protein